MYLVSLVPSKLSASVCGGVHIGEAQLYFEILLFLVATFIFHANFHTYIAR